MFSALRQANDESHFNVSLIVRGKVTRQCQYTAVSHKMAGRHQPIFQIPVVYRSANTLAKRRAVYTQAARDHAHIDLRLILTSQ